MRIIHIHTQFSTLIKLNSHNTIQSTIWPMVIRKCRHQFNSLTLVHTHVFVKCFFGITHTIHATRTKRTNRMTIYTWKHSETDAKESDARLSIPLSINFMFHFDFHSFLFSMLYASFAVLFFFLGPKCVNTHFFFLFFRHIHRHICSAFPWMRW